MMTLVRHEDLLEPVATLDPMSTASNDCTAKVWSFTIEEYLPVLAGHAHRDDVTGVDTLGDAHSRSTPGCDSCCCCFDNSIRDTHGWTACEMVTHSKVCTGIEDTTLATDVTETSAGRGLL